MAKLAVYEKQMLAGNQQIYADRSRRPFDGDEAQPR